MDIFKDITVFLESTPLVGGNSDSIGAENGNEQDELQTSTTTPPSSDGTTTDEPPATNWLFIIVLYGGMLLALYFFLFRPQRKREKQTREMQDSLRVSDNILTSGGFYGKIVGVGQDSFLVEFGENRGIRVWVRKSDVLGVKTPSTTPPPATPAVIEDKEKDKSKTK